MIRTVLSLYIVCVLSGTSIACAEPAEPLSTTIVQTTVSKMTVQPNTAPVATAQPTAESQGKISTTRPTADAGTTVQPTAESHDTVTEAMASAEMTCTPPAVTDDFTSADWAYVTRDENSTTYLRMDTIKHTKSGEMTISCGDIKKAYTKHGLVNVYHSLKETDSTDDESLTMLKQIDHAIMHVSYRQQGTAITHRLHRTTFYNKSGNAIMVFDFDDIALQTGAHLTWTPVTSRMKEEIAIFCRLANG